MLEPGSTGQVVLFFILLACSAFFAASEIALVFYGKLRFRPLQGENARRAKLVRKLTENPARLLRTVRVVKSLVNIAATALGAVLLRNWLYQETAVGIVILSLTVLVLLFGELAPEIFAATRVKNLPPIMIFPLYITSLLLTPLTMLLSPGVADQKRESSEELPDLANLTEEDFRNLVNAGEEEGVLENDEREMIHSIFEFGDTYVKNVMVPRTDMVMVENTITYPELLALIDKEQFSRIPVYEGNIDNVVGILHIKDIFNLPAEERENFSVTKYIRKAYYIPALKKVGELFRELQKQKVYMAIVVDEYGGTAGLVTMEDLVEEIVGEISDEYDEATPEIQQLDDRSAVVDARLPVTEVNEKLGVNLPEEESDTIGGLVFNQFGRVPAEKESVTMGDLTFEIIKMARRRIERVKITKAG